MEWRIQELNEAKWNNVEGTDMGGNGVRNEKKSGEVKLNGMKGKEWRYEGAQRCLAKWNAAGGVQGRVMKRRKLHTSGLSAVLGDIEVIKQAASVERRLSAHYCLLFFLFSVFFPADQRLPASISQSDNHNPRSDN